MRRTVLGIILAVSILFFAGCGFWEGLFGGGGGHPTQVREWTVMVYMSADNNMALQALDDINEMEMVGSSNQVTVVVQLDTSKSCQRLIISRDSDPQNVTSPVWQTLPPQNTGNPALLADFVKKTTTAFPAKHYALILWNHGSGWKPAQIRVQPRAICFDNTSNDALDTDELREALESTGVKLDFLGMDACLMQMVEVATEVKDWVGIVCASQQDEPWDGWPHDAILNALVRNPSMDAEQLGKVIVGSYINSYASNVTLSLVSTSALPQLASAINDLGNKLADLYPSSVIDSAINNAQSFSDDSYKDLFHFSQLISDTLQTAKREADSVRGLQPVVIRYNGQKTLPNAYGLSIFLPKQGFATYERSYTNLLFAKLTPGWVKFLKKVSGG